MIELFLILKVLLVLFGTIYFVIILIYTFGWFKLKIKLTKNLKVSTFVSVVIPARNEEKNILSLLSDLILQNYPKDKFEIIVVDDNSTDSTAELVNHFVANNQQFNIKYTFSSQEDKLKAYKKQAINKAIQISRGELIITTDADCRAGNNWLRSIVESYEIGKPKMIVGPVSFYNESTFFEKMQAAEFLSLIAITGGAIQTGRPIMCNGANLAYEKIAFNEVGGFSNDRFSSGDDVFLLLKIRKYFGDDAVRFLKNKDTIINTHPIKSLKDFIQQRTRWASKNKGYDLKIIMVSFNVYMINLLLIIGLLFSLMYPPAY